MTSDPKSPAPTQSFSPARRWKIGFNVFVQILLVLAVVVMANYIGSLFSQQFFLSSPTRVQLSPRTTTFLQSLTNRVDVTVYYDKDNKLYSMVMALLNEYHRVDPRIHITVVDYLRNAGEAEIVKAKYHLPDNLAHPDQPLLKNLIIFDCDGRSVPVPGDSLFQLGPTGMSKDKKIEFGPVAFKGEMMFTAALQNVTNPKPFIAYYLVGRGEPSPADTSENGYSKFGSILGEDYVRLAPLTLLGDSDVPSDCNLLIIAGPRQRFSDSELTKIDNYISRGGRLLVMFDYNSVGQSTGLEDVLARWGVNVGEDSVQDTVNTTSGNDVLVMNFDPSSPVVNPLANSELQMLLPRPIGPIDDPNAKPDAPTVTPLAITSDKTVLWGLHGAVPRSYPLMVSVEGNSADKGVPTPVANMRMVVVGDTMFLNNKYIEAGANRDFAGYAVNWLLNRPSLLNGIGPRPVIEYRLLMSKTQLRDVRWLLLGALPGTTLVLGSLVWLRRRK
ncbi:MAG TPA: DUF4350 domain-containing protein [Candidatus Sulfotelmatobacter sp.]|nr:DUF4350 domain-containing protein [Candidatus Sulfotelmatobacter sp.]